MKIPVLSLVLSAIPLVAIADGDSFGAAAHIAYDIIDAEASSPICQPAPISEAKRHALVVALSRISSPGFSDRTGLTPLDFAVMADDVPSIRRLVTTGYRLNSPKNSLLRSAAQLGSRQALPFLLSEGLDPDGPDPKNGTPLMVAASWNRLNLVRILLAAGASVNARTREGGTALAYAMSKPNPDQRTARFRGAAGHQGTKTCS